MRINYSRFSGDLNFFFLLLRFFIATAGNLDLRLAFTYLLDKIFFEAFACRFLFFLLRAATAPHPQCQLLSNWYIIKLKRIWGNIRSNIRELYSWGKRQIDSLLQWFQESIQESWYRGSSELLFGRRLLRTYWPKSRTEPLSHWWLYFCLQRASIAPESGAYNCWFCYRECSWVPKFLSFWPFLDFQFDF